MDSCRRLASVSDSHVVERRGGEQEALGILRAQCCNTDGQKERKDLHDADDAITSSKT